MPKILVIDDDPGIRLLYEKALHDCGFDVVVAGDGRQALERIAETEFDVTVLDIEMPDMSGLELLGQIRHDAPNLPIILNSAYTTYKADFKSWLADEYVVKSSDLAPLKAAISKILEAREHGRPA